MKNRKILFMFTALVITAAIGLTGLVSCKEKNGAPGNDTAQSTSVKDPFGGYPADYEIADLSFVTGLHVTVRDLLGSNDKFSKTFVGNKVSITIVSMSGDDENLSATLLITRDNGEKMGYLNLEFEADNTEQLSYLRLVELENVITGQVFSNSSYSGDPESRGRVAGAFYGVLKELWDMDKLR